jgi:hypothetical protein
VAEYGRCIVTKKDLSAKSVAELKSLAKKAGLTGYTKLRKDDLVALLASQAKRTKKPAAKRASTKRSATKTQKAPQGKSAKSAKGPKPAKAKTPSRKTPKARTEPAARKPAKPGVAGARARGDDRWESLSPRTYRAFSQYRTKGEQRVKASKYYLGVTESPEIDEGFEYPETYGESTITLMVRDPYWLFAYWEFAPNLNAELRARLGETDLMRSRLVLRIYDVTGADPDHPASYHDIDVASGSRNWYINVMRVERDYVVDLGLVTPDGSFIIIARSNVVSLPPVGPSEVVDEEWVTVEALGEFYARTTELGPSSGSGGWGSGGWGR